MSAPCFDFVVRFISTFLIGYLFSHCRDDAATICALSTLTRISKTEKGALAVVEAGTLHVLDELLGSSDIETRRKACHLLSEIASQESTSGDVLDMNPCQRLVSLLSYVSSQLC
jgi:hypothetical protein